MTSCGGNLNGQKTESHSDAKNSKCPLILDLDGSLLKTNTLPELIWEAFKKHPWKTLVGLRDWNDRPNLKKTMMSLAGLQTLQFPVNPWVKEFAQKSFRAGQDVHIYSGARQELLDQLKPQFPWVKNVVGTKDSVNMTGKNKAAQLVADFGEKNFDYVGNERTDLEVFKVSRRTYLVTNSALFHKEMETWHQGKFTQVFPCNGGFFKALWKGLRPHQWMKNFLVFSPFLLAQQFDDVEKWTLSLLSFIGFSLMASSVYFMNDLVDLTKDRKHPVKSARPLAAGELTLQQGILICFLCFFGAIGVSFAVKGLLTAVLLGYFFLNLFYSFFLKRLVLVDVFILASMYSLRLVAGAVATSVNLSSWLVIFSTFLFVSLGFMKRQAELLKLKGQSVGDPHSGRGYHLDDEEFIGLVGVSSGLISVLVFSLYIFGPKHEIFYATPEFLLGSMGVLFFWICSLWLKSFRGEMHEDPVLFVAKDKTSWISGFLVLMFWLLAIQW